MSLYRVHSTAPLERNALNCCHTLVAGHKGGSFSIESKTKTLWAGVHILHSTMASRKVADEFFFSELKPHLIRSRTAPKIRRKKQ